MPDTPYIAVRVDGTERERITRQLRGAFPYGHEDFLPTIVAQMELHSVKNHDYASGGSPLGNFERVSAILALYPGLNLGDKRVVALVYALKQLDAVLWGLAKNITHKVEGFVDRLNDIAVYANIVICMIKGDARSVAIDQQFGVGLPDKRCTVPSLNGIEVSAAGRFERTDKATCPELNQTRDSPTGRPYREDDYPCV